MVSEFLLKFLNYIPSCVKGLCAKVQQNPIDLWNRFKNLDKSYTQLTDCSIFYEKKKKN